MSLYDAWFWARFRDWHVRTEHRWDLRLHMEAMCLGIESVTLAIGEAVLAALDEERSLIGLTAALDGNRA